MLYGSDHKYVLFSRVRKHRNITFIGDTDTTVNAMEVLLKQKSPWDDYIQRLDRNVREQGPCRAACISVVAISTKTDPVAFRRIQFPSTANGYVFLLIGTRQPPLILAEQSENLQQSLYDHNTGQGFTATALPQLQTPGVLQFVTGFSDNTEINKSERCSSRGGAKLNINREQI